MASNAQNIINFGTSGLAIGDYTQSLFALSAPGYLPLYNQWSKYLVSSYPTLAGLINPVSTNVTFTTSAATLPSSAGWMTCAYGNGVWVAAAYNAGAGARSTNDGATWSAISFGTGTGLVAFGNGIFIATYTASYNCQYVISTDNGVTWSSPYSWVTVAGTNAAGQWRDLVYANGIWMLAGVGAVAPSTATPANSILTSASNGSSWTVQVAPFHTQSIAYGNGVWVAVSWNGGANFSRSTNNGVTWSTSAALPTALNSDRKQLAYGNGNFVQVGCETPSGYATTNKVNVSQDGGQTWTTYSGLPSSQFWNTVVFGNGVFVAFAGESPGGSGTATTAMATSVDGITWTARTAPSSQIWGGANFGTGSRFVVLSGGYSLTSANAATVDFGTVATTFVLPNVTSTLTGAIPYIKAT